MSRTGRRRGDRVRNRWTCLLRFLAAASVALLASDGAEARSWRVAQVPNAANVKDAAGGAVGCNLCHTAGGGSARNPFGLAVQATITDPADQAETFWDAALAALDSDGDGATNGEELLDAGGTWTAGDADPGDAASVTHPGDATNVRGSAATDRAVLVALYGATGGDGWTNRTNWLSNEPLSTWSGVQVTADGRVRSLDVRDYGLVGPIPAVLGNLDQLDTLNLWGNALSGSIPPELGKLANLRGLYLTDNDLTGDRKSVV